MSRESRFHDLIEAQDPEGKAAAWARLQKRLEEDPIPMPEPKKKRRSPAFRRMIAACVSCALVVVVGLSVGLGIGLSRPVDSTRYCSMADVEMGLADKTLKEYSEELNLNLLYLDWYDVTGEYTNSVYKLKDTHESVCYQETFADEDWNYITLCVTDNRTEMAFLSLLNEETAQVYKKNNISVYYKFVQGHSYANFEYEGYRYYLELDVEDLDYITEIAAQLLENA